MILLHLSRIQPQTGDSDVILSERGDRDSACEISNAAKLRQLKMNNTADSEHATAGGDNVNVLVRVPPFWPDDVDLWFSILEVHFKTARITSDEEKFQITVAYLDKSHAILIRDVLMAPPATGRYEFVKKELIERLGESDAKRLRQVIEKEQMGDRTPSRFYWDLRNLASNALADDLILTVWESRLPQRVRSILAFIQIKDPETRIQIADGIFQTTSETGQIVAESAVPLPAVTHPLGQNSGVGDPVAAALNALNDWLARIDGRMDQMQAQIAELRIDGHRRLRSQSRPHTQSHRRPRPREQPRQNGLCYYHAQYRERARKCTFPCSWNSGNETSRP